MSAVLIHHRAEGSEFPRVHRKVWLLRLAIGLTVAAALVISFVIGPGPDKAPVYAATVPDKPYPTTTSPVCTGTDGLGYGSTDSQMRLWVDSKPAGAVLLWIPRADDKSCRSYLTRLGASQAEQLAAEAQTAPALADHSAGTGTSNTCPGAVSYYRATAFLTYPGKAKAEVLQITLSPGCTPSSITAPGRAVQQLTGTMSALLKSDAPEPWASLL